MLDLPAAATAATSSPVAASTTAGDGAAGARRFAALGCVACHQSEERHRRAGLGGVGPDLRQAGARLRRAWIARWLAGPARLSPETLMPDPRLDAAEIADLAAYLGGLGAPPRPSSAARRDPALIDQGLEIARSLGCHGCHAIKPLQQAPVAGPDLDGFGDKPAALLDWGHHDEVPRSHRSARRWIRFKLRQPLAFDRQPGVLLMPWQALRPGELRG